MIYIYFLGPFLDFNWNLSNRPRSSDCIRRFIPVFQLCNVILLSQAAGAYGRSGHLVLQPVVLDHRRGPVCVSDRLVEALLVLVLLPSERFVIPILVQVS